MTNNLITLSTINNGALKAKELPTSLKILEFGETDTVKGPIIINDETLKSFDIFQRENGRVRVPIDFNHNSMPGTTAYENEQEPRRVAGYGRPVISNEGISLVDIVWTPIGQETARDYEDLSPAVILNVDNVVVGMDSLALTPTGAVNGLHFYSVELKTNMKKSKELKKEVQVQPLPEAVITPDIKIEEVPVITPLAVEPKVEPKVESVEIKQEVSNVETIKEGVKLFSVSDKLQAVKTKLDLPEDASDEEIVDALITSLDEEDEETMTASTYSADTSAKISEFTATITTLNSRLDDNEKEFIVYKATQEGKLIPLSADSIKTTKVEVLKEMVKNLPKGQVPMKVTTRVLNAGSSAKKSRMDSAAAIEAEINGKQ